MFMPVIYFILFIKTNTFPVECIELARTISNKSFTVNQQYEVSEVLNESVVSIIMNAKLDKYRIPSDILIDQKSTFNEFVNVTRKEIDGNSSEFAKFFIKWRPYSLMYCNIYSSRESLIFKEYIYYPPPFHRHSHLNSKREYISVCNEQSEEMSGFYTTSTHLSKCGLNQQSHEIIHYIQNLGSSISKLKSVRIDRNGNVVIGSKHVKIQQRLSTVFNVSEEHSISVDLDATVRNVEEFIGRRGESDWLNDMIGTLGGATELLLTMIVVFRVLSYSRLLSVTACFQVISPRKVHGFELIEYISSIHLQSIIDVALLFLVIITLFIIIKVTWARRHVITTYYEGCNGELIDNTEFNDESIRFDDVQSQDKNNKMTRRTFYPQNNDGYNRNIGYGQSFNNSGYRRNKQRNQFNSIIGNYCNKNNNNKRNNNGSNSRNNNGYNKRNDKGDGNEMSPIQFDQKTNPYHLDRPAATNEMNVRVINNRYKMLKFPNGVPVCFNCNLAMSRMFVL